MMEKKRILVLFGGCSTEYEVSLQSAYAVLSALDKKRYAALTVGITREGEWLYYTGSVENIPADTWRQDGVNCLPCAVCPGRGRHELAVFGPTVLRFAFDAAFPVLHGKNGEDGTIQGLFKLSGIPYVGCGTLASAVCMDKAVTHTLLSAANIEQAHYLWFYADRYFADGEKIRNKIAARLNFPVFVKPANAGSSVGVSKVTAPEKLDAAIRLAAENDTKVVVEEGIVGQEVECAVLGNRGKSVASPVGEIGAGAEFYDYDDKYKNGVAQLFIPARLPEDVAEEVRKTAVRAYNLLGCDGLSRVDFFVTEKEHRVILNEINTLPGFTSISMYPKLWENAGTPYSELLEKLIDCAFTRED